MEQIIRTYGKFLLEAAVFAAVLLLLAAGITDGEGNRGIFRIVGAQIQEGEYVSHRGDVDCYESESKKAVPAIRYTAGGALNTGSYATDSILQAVDYSGAGLAVHISSICDPGGTEQIGSYPQNVTQIHFARRGIYTVTASATDAWNRKSVCTIRIPVND